MTNISEIGCLIERVRELFNIEGYIRYNTPQYRSFHDDLTDFIYKNHLEDNDNWIVIAKNLVYKSTQYLSPDEANLILINLESIKRFLLKRNYEPFWQYMHPKIQDVARIRFDHSQYADAVEASFKEINVRLKKIVKQVTNSELDGAKLMTTCFSPNKPLLTIQDMDSETGRNIQQGYMEMFAGAMMGIRNPNAHANQSMSKEDTVRTLHLASLLMYKIDQAITTTGIQE